MSRSAGVDLGLPIGSLLASITLCCLATSFLSACGREDARSSQRADLLIRGGIVFDGGAGSGSEADVVVIGDRIMEVGPDAGARFRAVRVIDATGRIVAPGFIDPHTHSDAHIRSTDAAKRLNAPWLFQGVSTVVIGVDGGGTPDFAEHARWFQAHGVGTNVAAHVGFGAVRRRVLGDEARAPDADELAQMQALVASAMCEGAIGLSTGLFYAPQSFAGTEEVIALARVVARHGGIYDTHIRDESSYTIGLADAIREALEIGAMAALPVHIAHIKALGVDVHGQASAIIEMIEEARDSGQRVTADQYPWLASGTSLGDALVPRWAMDGGRPALLAHLNGRSAHRLRTDIEENLRRRGGAGALLLTKPGQPWTGQTLEQFAGSLGMDPVQAVLRLLRDHERVSVASFNMREDDLRLFMQQPWVVTSSDGSDGHPREYASFPKKYARYVSEEGVISLAEFIHRSTGLTAEILQLNARGYLRPGYFADIVIFDPERFGPRADYLNPRVLSKGVDHLLINGQLAIDDGALTGAAPGRLVLRGPGASDCL